MFDEVIALAQVNLSEKRAAYTELYTLYKKHGSLPSMKSAVDALADEMNAAEHELFVLESQRDKSRSDISALRKIGEREKAREINPILCGDRSRHHYMEGVREEPTRAESLKKVGFRSWDSIQRVPTNSVNFDTSGKTDYRVMSKATQYVTRMGSEDSYTPSYCTEMCTNSTNYAQTRDFDGIRSNTSSGISQRNCDDYDAYSGDFDSTNSRTYRRSGGYSKPKSSGTSSRVSISVPRSRLYTAPKQPAFSSEYPAPSRITLSSKTCSKPTSDQSRTDRKIARPAIELSQTQGLAIGGTALDATCIWFNEVTGEQMLFPKGVDPGEGYRSLYVNPR